MLQCRSLVVHCTKPTITRSEENFCIRGKREGAHERNKDCRRISEEIT